jgi:hypothetical protein
MVFRRSENEEQYENEDDDGLNIISDDDDEEGPALFEEGAACTLCSAEDGRVGLDPTCHGSYEGEPLLVGFNCLTTALKDAYAATDGITVIVEPFGDNAFHLYYRLDEMPAYQFPRDDIEPISWLLLARCGQQSHYAWLTPEFVDPSLPEDPDRAVFRNLDRDIEHLCAACAASALSTAYRALDLPLITAEIPRGAMGVLMPSGE